LESRKSLGKLWGSSGEALGGVQKVSVIAPVNLSDKLGTVSTAKAKHRAPTNRLKMGILSIYRKVY
jgi:hypothetical protein